MGLLDTESPGFVSLSSWKTSNEPVSVLDTRRSPSPSTSTSTFSGELRPPLNTNTWDALLSDSGQDEFLLRWISNEVINPNDIEAQGFSLSNPASGQNPFPQFPNLVPQFPNFTNYPVEAADEKPERPQFFGSFSSNLATQSDPLSVLHHPPLKRPYSGESPSFGNSTSYPQVPKFDRLPPVGQAVASPEPPFKRPNLGPVASFGNSISHPQVPKFDSFGQAIVSPQPTFKRPNAEDSGNFVSDPRFSELYKHPPETLPVVPQQIVYDQLYKAAEMILSGGNLTNAHSILARLNHQLTPGTLPFQRASFYLKEALLQLPLLGPGSGSCSLSRGVLTPVDGLFRMGAYKLLSEVSPLTNFVNFTSNQAMLEVVGDCELVHVIDFDIGAGAQWASFMTDLAVLGRRNKGTPCLKITAFASPLTHHPFELGLMHENLTQLANEIGVGFELEVVNLDGFDPNSYLDHLLKSDKETMLAVNFPIWAFSNRLVMLPSLIRFIKQLSPNIVVSMEHGYERSDLSFSNHLLHALQYHEALLQSIDAANTNSETVSKIEKFIIQPRIENIVLGRLGYHNQMPHWRALFAAAGFSQVNLSNFVEIQAECVLNKIQVRGFLVERRQTSLVLSWQGRELVTASAWRC